MSKPIRSQCSLYLHSGGSIILNIIIMIVIFASIIAAVVYMSSSSLRQEVSFNQSANAWNLADAGYRFLSTNYLNTPNVSGNADGDKAAFLSSVNGRTYVIPNNGSFTLTIKPYWFYNATATGTITSVTAQLPGTTPANFTMPATGQIKLGDTPGVGIRNYTTGVFNSGTGVFTCNLATNYTISTSYSGYSVYLVLNPNATQNNLSPGSNLTLNISNYALGAFPATNGLIEIAAETRLYRYSNATKSGSVLTLTNLQHSDKSAFSINVTAATTVTFKKCMTAQSLGQVGPEKFTLKFNQAILDSTAATPPVKVVLDTAGGLTSNFSQSSSITGTGSGTLGTSGGGSGAFSYINSVTITGTGANAYSCGAFWYNNSAVSMNTQWGSSNNLLSYDVQVKAATINTCSAGTVGLAIRAKKVILTTEPDAYLGLTFMRYDLANIYFTAGSAAINPGDTLQVFNSNNYTTGVLQATGVVQGTPEITSGSWAAGNATGKIRFASFTVTGTVANNYYIRVNGVNVAQIPASGTNYFPAATTDYIPGAIKPKPSDFDSFPSSPFYLYRYNIGPLLLVLWERKSDGTFRWLAFKNISNSLIINGINGDDDYYVKGLQDWVPPAGSCTVTCPGNDGEIINDAASIYIRIQEKRVVLGSGSAVKVNDINLFYGDDSGRYTTPARPGTDKPYDINELRQRYHISSPLWPIWVPQYISQWDQTVDFFSHIESGTPTGSQPQFQWDAVNPNVTDISVLKICDDASAACTSTVNGTLRLTELVTPDSGTYQQPEIGMIACMNFQTSGTATAGWAEFALMFPAGSAAAGGFLGTSFGW